MTARGDADLITALRLADTARGEVERLAHQLQCEAAVLVGLGPDELTTAFSACGGTAELVEPLGQRIPLIPPIGEAYVAGAAPDVVERWLAKVTPKDDQLVEQYRARLASVERRGAGISLLGTAGPVEYERLGEALREYGTGELTPARERQFRGLLASTKCFFEDRELAPGETYRVGGIVVPVRNPEGDISMVLRVTQLPRRPPAPRSRRGSPPSSGPPARWSTSSAGPLAGAPSATTATGTQRTSRCDRTQHAEPPRRTPPGRCSRLGCRRSVQRMHDARRPVLGLGVEVVAPDRRLVVHLGHPLPRHLDAVVAELDVELRGGRAVEAERLVVGVASQGQRSGTSNSSSRS